MKTTKLEQLFIPRVAGAVRKLATAASARLGSDCYIHAAIAQALLARLDVKADLRIGQAAWRTGNGCSDVIVHAPVPGMPPQPGGVPYHAWLEVGDNIFDNTCYQLPAKGIRLDALDGGHTNIDWHPDFLFVPVKSVSPLHDVIQKRAGLYYYHRDLSLEEQVMTAAPALDAADVEAAWVLYQNPGMVVFGPNDINR